MCSCAHHPKASDDDDILMLPFVSMSSWALLAMLGRWCSMCPRLGGFDKEAHRTSAGYLFSALVAAAAASKSGGTVFDIVLQDDWQVKCPRPHVDEPSVKLCVCPTTGMVDTAKFMAEVALCGGGRRGWWRSKELTALCASMEHMPMASMLTKAGGCKRLQCFYLQLLWQVGARVQKLVLDGLASSKGSPWSVKKVAMADLMDEPNRMERRLVSYVLNGRLASSQHQCFSCCTDKSSVNGLGSGVQSTIFVLPNSNEAIFAPPQVRDPWQARQHPRSRAWAPRP